LTVAATTASENAWLRKAREIFNLGPWSSCAMNEWMSGTPAMFIQFVSELFIFGHRILPFFCQTYFLLVCLNCAETAVYSCNVLDFQHFRSFFSFCITILNDHPACQCSGTAWCFANNTSNLCMWF